jgi:hypothetical protein
MLNKLIKRRSFTQAGLFTFLLQPVITYHSFAAQGANNKVSGCCLMSGGDKYISRSRLGPSSQITNPKSNQAIENSGDPHFDESLGIVLADISRLFEVRPGFAYFDDTGSPNALALPDSHLANSHGTVLFGKQMLAMNKQHPYGDMFIMGICAHEFAHIVQFFSGYHDRLSNNQSTKKFVELHADFLSGYYIGKRNISYSNAELYSLGESWESIGDSSYTDPDHHGTAEERLEAIEQGYRLAKKQPSLNIKVACENGMKYLKI